MEMYSQMSWITLLAHWAVSGVALLLTAALTPGFRVRGFFTALLATLIIGLANIFVRPFLVFLSLPLTILTLGLFLFVIDAIILRVCAAFLKDFEITNWFSAILGAIVLAVSSSFLHWMFV